MNELMLIDMMSELDPKFINNRYIENDMRKFHFLNFFKKKTKDNEYDFPFLNQENLSTSKEESNNLQLQNEDGREGNLIYFNKEIDNESDNDMNSLFDIGIYKKKIKGIYKILSGIAAAIFLILGIVMIIIKKQKRGGVISVFKTT